MSGREFSASSQVLKIQEEDTRYVGKAVPTLESARLVKGTAGFTDDLEIANQHYAAFLFSPYAHAKILSIDVSKAIELPGVSLVLTGSDLKEITNPINSTWAPKSPTSHYLMAVEKVRYMGEPVAAVVARTKYIAVDAIDLIEVDYEPLESVTSIEGAVAKDAPLVYPELGSNEILTLPFNFGAVEKAFQSADKVIKERFKIQRYSSTPLETFVIIAHYDITRDELQVYATDQRPMRTVQVMENTLGVPASKIHLVVPPMGGGFGYKQATWQYVVLVSLLSKLARVPVKWTQTRTESLYAFHRPRGYMDAEFALRKDGKVLGMKFEDWQADANMPYDAGIYALTKFGVISGPYDIRNISFRYHSIAMNDPPITTDRGVGKPFMSFVLERMMDISARELGMDRIKIRETNTIPHEKMPYTTATGEIYESGNYPEALRRGLKHADYERMLELKRNAREQGRYVGIGIATGIEPGTGNASNNFFSSEPPDFNGAGQMATVEITSNGSVKVNMNCPEIGTGHMTTIAQVVSDVFGLTPSEVRVDPTFDTLYGHLSYAGVYSNAFNDVYLGAVLTAARRLREKAIKISAWLLKEDEEVLNFSGGYVCKVEDGNEKRLMTLEKLARISYNRLLSLPKTEDAGLRVTATYTNPLAKPFAWNGFNFQLTHSNAVHICLVEINPENWSVKILDYAVLHDAGKMINPGIVDGLVIGSTISGIGQALYEEFVFNEQGTNLSVTFGDYLKPTSMEPPDIRLAGMESPHPHTVLGTKAVGEGASITSLGALAGSIEDALEPFKVRITELPLTPERIWNIVKKSSEYSKAGGRVS